MSTLTVDLIIPAYNEEASLPAVLEAVPRELVRHIYVVDNGSEDDTARTAAAHGAIVLGEVQRGYGSACRRGALHAAASTKPPEVLVFMHADGSDDPREILSLVRPIERQRLDLVIGSRTSGPTNGGLADRFSRVVAVTLIRALYGQRYTDLGGFRALRLPALVALAMSDEGPGWNVEMQVKAAKAGLRVAEVPVSFRQRTDADRTRSLTARARASSRMLYTILRHSTSR